MIGFNIPAHTGKEIEYIKEAIDAQHICGDGIFTKKCDAWMEEQYHAQKVLLTTSCTHALEMAVILAGIGPGDEVILPSYTFSSTADAVVMRGATLVFVDIRQDTMNLNEHLIEDAITERTKAIIAVHYAGVACEMDEILAIAKKHHLIVIEDAAQGVHATYKGRALGTIGDFGCYSFHETKNYNMGEGGALLIRDEKYNEKAEILREKGTNRSKFFRGQIDKYTWVDFGSSYLPSDMNAAYLWAQLEMADQINEERLTSYEDYEKGFEQLSKEGLVERPVIPEGCRMNGHMFYLKVRDLAERSALITFLREHGVQAVFHYIPLHSAPAGLQYGRFHGEDRYTTVESERLVRLPMYYGLTSKDRKQVIDTVYRFYNVERK